MCVSEKGVWVSRFRADLLPPPPLISPEGAVLASRKPRTRQVRAGHAWPGSLQPSCVLSGLRADGRGAASWCLCCPRGTVPSPGPCLRAGPCTSLLHTFNTVTLRQAPLASVDRLLGPWCGNYSEFPDGKSGWFGLSVESCVITWPLVHLPALAGVA